MLFRNVIAQPSFRWVQRGKFNLLAGHLYNTSSQSWRGYRLQVYWVSENSSPLLLLCTALLSMLVFACVVGVNPAPTILSRSSPHCNAPWWLYCTSFLGQYPLRSGRSPRGFVEESEGPSLLQCFIPLPDRCMGKIRGGSESLRQFAPHSQSFWTTQSSDWTAGSNVRTQTCSELRAPVFRQVQSQSGFSIDRRHCDTCCTATMLWNMVPKLRPFSSLCPVYGTEWQNPFKPIHTPHTFFFLCF